MLRIFLLILTTWTCFTSALPASNKIEPFSRKTSTNPGKAESFGGFLCGLGQMAVGGTLIATGLAFEIATVGGYTIGFALQTEAGLALMASGCAQAMYESRDISFNKFDYNNSFYPKKHTPDQTALSDLVKGPGKKGISNTDADTLLDWAKEYDFPHRDDRGKPHWEGGEHIHIGPKHVPVQPREIL